MSIVSKELINSISKKHLSTSSKTTFQTCRQKWLLYKLFTPKVEKNYFKYGTLWHYALEIFYSNQDEKLIEEAVNREIEDYKNNNLVMEEEVTELNNQLDTLSILYKFYKEWAKERDNFKVIDVEKEDILEIDGTEIRVRLDAIVEDEMGGLWVLEHKTAKQFDEEKYEIDQQVSMYTYVAQKIYGKKFEGVIINLSKKGVKPETELPRLKNGGLSKDKNKYKKIPYPILEKIVREEGLEGFDEMLNQMKNDNYFFKRVYVKRTEEELDLWLEQMKEFIKEYKNTDSYLPNPNWTCHNMCQFYDVCKMYLKGRDHKDLLNSLYDLRKDKQEEMESKEDKED
jgi:hypothetical protein